MAARNHNRGDGDLQAFGSLRDQVRDIKNNDPRFQWFELEGQSVRHYSDREWELLGQYIADNDYLTNLIIRTHGYIGGAQLSVLCRTMVGSRSLETLELGPDDSDDGFSLELGSVRSLVPFLENSPNLTNLDIRDNPNIDSRCFRLLLRALDGGPIETLNFTDCSVDDMAALGNCTLPRLRLLSMGKNGIQLIPPLQKHTNLSFLNLSFNNIGKDGCRLLAELLQNERSSLKNLYLCSNDIDDEAAEMLANSIKQNTTLTYLHLNGNKFNEAGCKAFLKLLNDSSSIEKTYNSNHTLKQLTLSGDDESSSVTTIYEKHTFFATEINYEHWGDPHAIGKAKIVATQLNSARRRELCRLQGIEYSLSNLLSEIEPALLPDLLAMTEREHDLSELYLTLIASAPDLTSLIDKRAMLMETIARNTSQISWHSSQIADLTSMNLSLNKRLETVTFAGNILPAVAKERTSTNGCGNKKKRKRAGS